MTPSYSLDQLKAGLRYVYVGNVPDEEDTSCHSCGCLLIRRSNFQIVERITSRQAGTAPTAGRRWQGWGWEGPPESRKWPNGKLIIGGVIKVVRFCQSSLQVR